MTDNNSSTTNLVCFGDVIKLSTKSAFAPTEDGACLGFLEQKSALLLVVPPAKDEVKDKFTEAEFIVSPIRGDKPPAKGTPLSYKQPFVLKTSDGSGYSLNNKTPNMSDVVSLQVSGIKGEMYVAVEKQGFAGETHVHDGDMGVELVVVDSNRIRKNYNKTLTHYFAKNKSDAAGGFVSSGGKGPVLSFKIVKVADKTETRTYVKEPVFRRASQEMLDPVKADETSEASVLESPSRAGSIVTTAPLVVEEPASETKKEEQPQTQEPVVAAAPSTVSETATVSATSTTTETASTPAVTAPTGGVSADALAAQLQKVAAKETTPEPVVAKPVVEQAKTEAVPAKSTDIFAGLSTIELTSTTATTTNTDTTADAAAVVDVDGMDGSVPVNLKLATASPRVSAVPVAVPKTTSEATLVTTASAVDVTFHEREEQVDTGCIGKCAIM